MELLGMLLQVFVFGMISYLACTYVHEGGHVIMGLLQKWKFYYMTFGPFRIYREEKDDRVKFGMEKDLLYWGGVGLTIPREQSEKNIQAYARILLAGPVASVLWGIGWGITLCFHFSLFQAMMAGMSVSMGIACLIPNAKTGFLYTDGGRFLRIVRGGKTLAEEKAILEAAILKTIDPEGRYDEKGIETMTASEDVSFRYMGHYYGYLNAKKDQRKEEMEARIGQMKLLEAKVPKTIQDTCPLEG